MHTECVSDVPAAEVGAAPELVTGLGVGAATCAELRAGGLAAAGKTWLNLGVFSGMPTLTALSVSAHQSCFPWLSEGSPHLSEVKTEAQIAESAHSMTGWWVLG